MTSLDPTLTSYTAGFDTPTSTNSAFVFYDLESLGNIFTTAAYDTLQHHIAVFFHLDDTDTLTSADVMAAKNRIIEAIISANPAVLHCRAGATGPQAPTVSLHDLTEDNSLMIMIRALGGVCFDTSPHIHDPYNPDNGVRVITNDIPRVDTEGYRVFPEQTVCDTHPNYRPGTDHPFIVGYNSINYDTTILALYYAHRLRPGATHSDNPTRATETLTTVTAEEIRRHNDRMFSPEFINQMPKYLDDRLEDDELASRLLASRLRASMLNSGRHVDLARLNELQSKVGLKRLLGQMGHQILESDRKSGNDAAVHTLDDVVDLFAYNVSDVIGTWLLFTDRTYSGAFDLRSGLLRTYPETTFNHTGDYAMPNIRLDAVDSWRLTVSTSSAQFAAKILAPYRKIFKVPGHNGDLPVVSLRYPDKKVAADTGREQVNVLTELRNFMLDNIDEPEALGNFRRIYEYYRTIEGMNFDEQVTTLVDTVQALRTIVSKPEIVEPSLNTRFEKLLPRDKDYYRHPGNAVEPSRFTLGELVTLLDDITTAVTTAHATGLVNRNALDTVAETTAYLAMYYQAKAHSALGFNPADDPVPGSEPVTYPPADASAVYLDEGLASVAKAPGNIPYVDAEGRPTGCFAAFSTGGIHGAEYNTRLYAAENTEYTRTETQLLNTITAAHEAYTELVAATDAGEAPSTRGLKVLTHTPAYTTLVTTVHDTVTRDPASLARLGWMLTNGPDEITLADGTVLDTDPLVVAEGPWPKTDHPRFTEILSAGLAWLDDTSCSTNALRNAATAWADVVDEIRTTALPEHTGLSLTQIAEAAMYLSRMMSVHLDNDTEVPKADVLLAKSKAVTPWFRSTPKGHTKTSLFQPKRTTKPPAFPAGSAHRENKLNQRYVFTSVDDVIHEDFTSYYPLMLSNMAAFTNPDLVNSDDPTVSRDRYREIFNQKEAYGKQMKDPSISDAERASLGILREGTKLILNSASGAADAGYPTRILMNNRIIAMRMIGQLLSYRIGQAQSLAGARIVSTNTDGLYSTLDAETNNRILDEQTAAIGVEIEPEELTLVSKDSNNRVEFMTAEASATAIAARSGRDVADIAPWERITLAASGGTLACASGPNPRKALNHPAVSDHALVEYFKYVVGGFVPDDHGIPAVPGYEGQALSVDQPMNPHVVSELILPRLRGNTAPREVLTFYQNLVASSPGMNTYLFTVPYTLDTDEDGTTCTVAANDHTRLTFDGDTRGDRDLPVTALQHYNRCFIVDPDRARANGLEDLVTLAAVKTKVINEASRTTRARRDDKPVIRDLTAMHLLRSNGVDLSSVSDKDFVVAKHTGVDPATPMVIVNDTLLHNPDDDFIARLLDSLDMSAYVDMIVDSYTSSWRNTVPEDPA